LTAAPNPFKIRFAGALSLLNSPSISNENDNYG